MLYNEHHFWEMVSFEIHLGTVNANGGFALEKILDLLVLNPGTKVGMDSELSVEHRYYLRSQSKRAPHGICQLQ